MRKKNLSDSDNTNFFTTPDGRKIPGKWGYLTNSKTGNDFKVFEPKDPLSSIRFNGIMDWGMGDLLPCRLGCDRLVRYKTMIFSDGYCFQYPVNPETSIDPDGEMSIEVQDFPNQQPDTPELMHICHFDSKEFNPALNDVAFSLLGTHFEDEFRYPNILEQITDLLKNLNSNSSKQSDLSHFKSYLNAYPTLCARDSYSDEAEKDLLILPLLTLIEYYSAKKSFRDAIILYSLQSNVFEKMFNTIPDLKSGNFQETWKEIGSILFDKKIKHNALESIASKEKIKTDEVNKRDVDELVDKIEIKFREYIRNKIPDWNKQYPEKLQKAQDLKKISQKSIFGKDSLDYLPYLSLNDLLWMSKIKFINHILYQRIKMIIEYRNEIKSHPPDEPSDPELLKIAKSSIALVMKDFEKLELR